MTSPRAVAELEGSSLREDPTIKRLSRTRSRRTQTCARTSARRSRRRTCSPIGRSLTAPSVATALPLSSCSPPDRAEPRVLCLDGPRGLDASEHRNGPAELCLYFKDDPPERRWRPRDGLLRLFDLARQHLVGEYLFRQNGAWPFEEAPHGNAATPVARDPTLELPPLRRPGRNDPCSCGSGLQSEEVLLAMKIRPFLSHKREDKADVGALREALKVYGAGGWKDVEDLRLGVKTEDELVRAIHELTGGFIWWGTRKALGSTWINDIEIPNAVARAATKPPYPIVPLFVDLRPGGDEAAIRAALGMSADDFLSYNGEVFDGALDPEAFRGRVASRYVRDAIAGLPAGPLTVAFRALSEPDGGHDLTFDWRALVNARRRALLPGALELMTEALANALEAAQARTNSPDFRVEPDLPLPLAYLVGYEWRITTRARLEINQRTGSTFHWISADGPTVPIAAPVVVERGVDGPTVVLVSCRSGAPGAADRYADSVGAGRLVTLHVDGLLSDEQVRGLARTAADALRAANDRGVEKHLLIVGPAVLSMLIGAAANACGRVTVPMWDGTSYVSPIVVG